MCGINLMLAIPGYLSRPRAEKLILELPGYEARYDYMCTCGSLISYDI